MTDISLDAPRRFRFRPLSFRMKFVLVVGGALLADLFLAGGIALWNVNRLSTNATQQVGRGLEKAITEYLRNYLDTTVERTELLLDQYHAEVEGLAGAMQTLIDRPELKAKIGEVLEANPAATTPLAYNAAGNWWQNQPGEASAVTVWGYLLDQEKKPLPAALADVRESAAFNIFGPSFLKSGPPKLQMYYIGPRATPILRSTPYNDQGKVFDEVYPGHNKTNWWDFYFPGLYETWQDWLGDPSKRPVASDIVTLSPYLDGITGKIIVSFFQPLYTPDRKDLHGIVGVDLTLDQLADIVQSVKIADTGFAFLSTSSGNVLAISPAAEKTLGIQMRSENGFDRTLGKSSQPAIARLAMPTGTDTVLTRISLSQNGEDIPYLVLLKQMSPTNLFTGKAPVVRESFSLGFMVPEREVYASLLAAKTEISSATQQVLLWQVATVLVCLMIVMAAVFAISGRITAGLSALAHAADRLKNKDYSVRVDIPSKDEVGAVGVAFNRMAEEISFHTENLENLVASRTQDLAQANEEISSLNAKLRSENLRLGAELDVARHIQMMVLPRAEELDEIRPIEVSGYMEPADEVGGDYFDVLRDGDRIKIGIGDVTGHGLESGVLMLMVQSVARALQERGDNDPAAFLDVLNRAIYKNIERTRTDKHLTLAFLDYEPGRLTLSGQHEEVLVVRAGGEVERIDTIDLGFPIGLERDIAPFVATRDIDFAAGDVIVLYTDGVTEAESPDGRLFGLNRLAESARRLAGLDAEAIKTGILSDLRAHIGTQKIHDDITLVVMRHK
jgi:sigma-B regulation protein RsbU (phosphoserine phosphatase)